MRHLYTPSHTRSEEKLGNRQRHRNNVFRDVTEVTSRSLTALALNRTQTNTLVLPLLPLQRRVEAVFSLLALAPPTPAAHSKTLWLLTKPHTDC